MSKISLSSRQLIFISVLAIALFTWQGCAVDSGDTNAILYDVPGTLIWGGLPAVDGSGILFETENETFGAPGNRQDYEDYLPEGENRVSVVADIRLTGDTAVRGWLAEFPEIEFINVIVTGSTD